ISDQTVDYAGNSMESVYSWEFTTELVIIVEPPSSLRGNYVGIYDLLAFGSGFAGLLGWDSVSWTFTDLSHHAEFTGEYSRFCDYGGTYSIGKELNLTRTTILDQVCDPNEVPEGIFTYRLIVLDNAADTLYFEQTNEANNRRKSIKLVKQE
ncbi:MAG: hypothetical protein GY865_05570, partial [candidate division Zixibacteria bacterium]|nr:hypothetical protein [candidate division Zixibacteria bacterium]